MAESRSWAGNTHKRWVRKSYWTVRKLRKTIKLMYKGLRRKLEEATTSQKCDNWNHDVNWNIVAFVDIHQLIPLDRYIYTRTYTCNIHIEHFWTDFISINKGKELSKKIIRRHMRYQIFSTIYIIYTSKTLSNTIYNPTLTPLKFKQV